MSRVKSFSVGNGDMFYIRHDSDNFSIIDCCLNEDNQQTIVDELIEQSAEKSITRFISTHPDEDHLRGLRYLESEFGIPNFYCVRNNAFKEEETDDFVRYCELRDADKAFYLYRGCKRKWMNLDGDGRGKAGIHIKWPDIDNADFKAALTEAEGGGSPNNISAVIRYGIEDGASFLWMGDLETEFMEKIADTIKWPKTDVVFAAHHGRGSGRIPHSILDQLQPKIIVLGEAPSRYLHYYGGYNTLTQNSAGDITFECDEDGKAHIFVSRDSYEVNFLSDEDVFGEENYLGTLEL